MSRNGTEPSDRLQRLLELVDQMDEEEVARRLTQRELELLPVLREHGVEGVAKLLYMNPKTVESMFVGHALFRLTEPRDEEHPSG